MYQSAAPDGWTASQSHGGLTGATPERLAEVQMMDKAFNAVHGAGAQLRIFLFTSIKYHARVRSLNEDPLIPKRKASDQNCLPKRTKTMRDFTKDGHFMNQ